MFPAIFDQPKNVRFSEQEEDEKIELFLRQHGFVNLGWVIGSIIAVLFPVLLIQIDLIFALKLFSIIPVSMFIAGIVIWYMLVVAFVFEKFLHWYFNIYIVTNLHIVDVNFISLMYRHITEAQLEDIQNVSSSVKGVFGPIFNFGDVVVETAGNSLDIDFASVPKPDFVADRIQDLRRNMGHSHGGQI